jgi:hypothetical protein
MKWFFLITLFVTEALAQSQTSYIPYTRTLRAKGYQIGVYNDSFTSQKYIDNDGKKQDFSDGYSFNRIQSEVSGHYGATMVQLTTSNLDLVSVIVAIKQSIY